MKYIIQNNEKVLNKEKDEHIIITLYFQVYSSKGPVFGRKAYAKKFTSVGSAREFMVRNNLRNNFNKIVRYEDY